VKIVSTFKNKIEAHRRTRRGRVQFFAAGGLCVLMAAGCNFPGKPNPADQPVPSEKVLKFSTLYAQNCAGCHGATGAFGPAPPLNSPLFRAIVSEADLERVIREGRKGTPMPAFAQESGGTLSPVQIQVLVHEIKGIPYKIVGESASQSLSAEKFSVEQVSSASAPGAIALSWAAYESPPVGALAYLLPESKSPRTSEEIEKIRLTTFARACAGCHGDHGQGAERAGAVDDGSLLALMSNQFLRRVVITGRTDLGMPDYAGTKGRSADFQPLSASEVAELVELLGYWRQQGAPPGNDAKQPKAVDAVRVPTEKASHNAKSS
jgi:mono/diheme cytochrome c family protein